MIPALTSFRFLTAFFVFLFHCHGHLNWKTHLILVDRFVQNSAVFMTGFFVLSGFILAHTYDNFDFSLKKNIVTFYWKRFSRIYPTYIACIFVGFLLFRHPSQTKYLKAIVNDLFLLQGFFPSMFSIGINGGTWSLSVELFLYFLMPFLMILFKKSYTQALFVAFIFSLIVSINAVLYKEGGDSLYSNPIFRIPDFLFGIGFYWLCQKRIFAKHEHILSIVFLFAGIIFLGSEKKEYMQGQFLFAPLFGSWIACVFYSKAFLYNNCFLEYLGKISYSFYLWQHLSMRTGKILIQNNILICPSLVSVAVFGINLALSIISYHFLEEPCRKLILKKKLSL
jgi:peptidoglycan/LPS O-acetylase OafA/YrhL